MPVTNPFKPAAGKMPRFLIGRNGSIFDFEQALVNSAGAPDRIMILTGVRDYSITVLHTAFRKIALQYGSETLPETAEHGLIDRIITALNEKTGLHLNSATLNRPSAFQAEDAVIQGITDAISECHRAVCALVFSGCSDVEKIFLRTLASVKETEVAVARIIQLANHSECWANKYRSMLIKNKHIIAPRLGYVSSAGPYLPENLLPDC